VADTYYAWTTILTGEKDDKGQGKSIKLGDKVSAGDVGGDEQFEELVAVGAVRKQKYPEDVAFDESPVESYKRKMNEAVEEAMAGAELEAYQSAADEEDQTPEQAEVTKAPPKS